MTHPPTALVPEDAASWLDNQGWTRVSESGAPASLWRRGRNELLVPETMDASDFRRRATEFLVELGRIEKKTPEDVEAELVHENVDVAEWRASGTIEDSIPLAEGVQLVSSARDALVAAAAARLHRRGYFGHSVPQQAREQAQRVRMGHTRRGSYIVPVVSRLPRSLASPATEEMFDVQLATEPFERQTMYTLVSGLSALHEMTVQVGASPNTRNINESVGEGMSYELSNSVRKILAGLSTESLDVSFSWARRSPLATEQPGSLAFPREAYPIIDDVTARLRGSGIVAEQSVVAFVRSVSRDRGQASGKVQLRITAGQEGRLVNVELPPRHYELATQAHLSGKAIVVRGRLRREAGRTWRFDDVSDVREAETLTLAQYEDLINEER